MRFFSKITFICNLCFIASVIMRQVEIAGRKKSNAGDAILLQPIQSTLVVLGHVAIIVNFIFNVTCLVYFAAKAAQPVPKWLIWFNFLLLLIQTFYFFF